MKERDATEGGLQSADLGAHSQAGLTLVEEMGITATNKGGKIM